MEIAYLFDGGYVKASLIEKGVFFAADNILKLHKHIRKKFSLSSDGTDKSFYFDCAPFRGEATVAHPLTHQKTKFNQPDRVLLALAAHGFEIVRERLKHTGWSLKKELLGNVSKMALRIEDYLSKTPQIDFTNTSQLAKNIAEEIYRADDFEPLFQQKKVDGLIMEKMTDLVLGEKDLKEIVLISNDSDFAESIRKNKARASHPITFSLIHLDGPQSAVAPDLNRNVDQVIDFRLPLYMGKAVPARERISAYRPKAAALINQNQHTR